MIRYRVDESKHRIFLFVYLTISPLFPAQGSFGQGGFSANRYGGMGNGGLGGEMEGMPVGMGGGGEPLGYKEHDDSHPRIPGICK